MEDMRGRDSRVRVCAVSYLNTLPLVWGMLRGPQRDVFDVSFSVPSVCADRLRAGEADIGLVPSAELDPQQLSFVSTVGIACRGAVRSILLISKVPPREIRTLAADVSSRTSVMLTRIVLAERYGAAPKVITMRPELENMLASADAALIIGDPALRIEPSVLPYHVADLGQEWFELTGLPMVFAVWAGAARFITGEVSAVFEGSYRFGLANFEDVLDYAERTYRFPREFARSYLTRNLISELGPRELEGLALFRKLLCSFRSGETFPSGILIP